MNKLWLNTTLILTMIAALVWFSFLSRPRAPSFQEMRQPLSPSLLSAQADLKVIGGAEDRFFMPVESKNSPFAVLYIHGFSASPKELSPLVENLCERWSSPAYFLRLRAHGFSSDNREEFKTVRAEDWLIDARRGLMQARTLAKKVRIIGMSTGAILALALAAEFPEDIESVVLLSPNFAPADPKARIFTFGGGETLARGLAGSNRTWTAINPEQEMFWSTSYDLNAITQMMRLLQIATAQLLLKVKAPTLVVYTPHDTVVDISQILANFGLIGSEKKELKEFPLAKDHILAGDIVSKETTPELEQLIDGFFR